MTVYCLRNPYTAICGVLPTCRGHRRGEPIGHQSQGADVPSLRRLGWPVHPGWRASRKGGTMLVRKLVGALLSLPARSRPGCFFTGQKPGQRQAEKEQELQAGSTAGNTLGWRGERVWKHQKLPLAGGPSCAGSSLCRCQVRAQPTGECRGGPRWAEEGSG